jgi:hypothetical protein
MSGFLKFFPHSVWPSIKGILFCKYLVYSNHNPLWLSKEILSHLRISVRGVSFDGKLRCVLTQSTLSVILCSTLWFPFCWLKGRGNEADFLGFWQKLVPHRSLTIEKQLPDSASRGVADSPTRRVEESAFESFKKNSASRRVATPRLGESGSQGVAMVSRGVAI